MDISRYDALGGMLTIDVHNEKIWLLVSEALAPKTQAHILTYDDAVGVATDLLRLAHKLGDPRPEVLAALGALVNLRDRQERYEALGETVMGDAS